MKRSLLLSSAAMLMAMPAYANHMGHTGVTGGSHLSVVAPEQASATRKQDEAELRGRVAEGETARQGADDGPAHDATDDKGGNGADDGASHDASDDHGGDSAGSDDSADHDAGDDHGSDSSGGDDSSGGGDDSGGDDHGGGDDGGDDDHGGHGGDDH